MANQGAKKRRDENQRHMTMLFRLIAICNAIYILVRLIIMHSSFTWKHWLGLLVTSAAYALPYLQLSNMAQPSYDENGDLFDGGFDMSTGGICGYLHDVIYITSFVQLGSIISDKFWYTYLVIPAFAAYKLYDISKGWFGGSEAEPEDEKARRKREKMERKASRTKFVRMKNR
uniref:TSA: Wollemia nobilis Ref_Wollemi_Transcript_26089_767 transcribed RNA sequence n=1 Tax=Wollemia nobilis TaxID=56998 RepID=A0A0C9RGP5_9CONI